MSNTLRKFSTSLKSLIRGDRNAEFPAFLGNLAGTIKADQGGNVYVTLLNGEVRTVYNDRVPNVPRLPVVIGYDGTEKMHVLRSRDVFPSAPYPDVPNHAFMHTFPGPDTLPVRAEQFLPGLVTPKTGLTVKIYSLPYELADGWHVLATQEFDLTSSVPASGAKYARLEADDTGAVTISLGTAVDARSELELSDIPAADPEKFSLAAVKLYAGQTTILFLPTDTDIIDLRFGRQTITPAVLADLTDGGTTTLHNHDGRYPREYAGKTAAPTVNDDSGDGYAIGDLWIDETNDKVYQALNVTVGAAVWVEITGGGGGGAWGSITGTLSDQTDLQNALDDKEDAVNKVTTMTGNTTSNIVFLTAKAVYDWAVGLFSQIGHSHSAPDASAVTYTPADSTDWNSSTDPGDVDDALNQLADRTKTLEGSSGGGDWELITDSVLGSSAANFDLTSIPGTYKHLRLEYSLRSDRASFASDRVKVLINNDTASNKYESILYYWYHSSTWGTIDPASTTAAYATFVCGSTALTNSFGGGFIDFPDYTASKLKLFQTRGGQMQSTTIKPEIYDGMAVWRDTSAITRITISPAFGSNWVTGSRVTLYGKK